MSVLVDRLILWYERQAMLDGRRKDQAVGGIAWEGGGEAHGGIGDRRGPANGSEAWSR